MNNQDQSASPLTDRPRDTQGCSSPSTGSAGLAARIPFRMLTHISGDKYHSGRYTNHTLGIGHEYHHPAKDGYVKTGPRVKVTRWFYRESPADAPCFKTLRELLDADAELLARAEAAYPMPNASSEPCPPPAN